MMLRLGLFLLGAAGWGSAIAQPPAPLKAGSEFQSHDIRELQADEFANPAMLWVAQGRQLWLAPRGAAGKSCADCHGAAEQSMAGAATGFPKSARQAGRLLNLEGQINTCAVERQKAPPMDYESDALLALTAYVARQSRGMPMAVIIDGARHAPFEEGRRLYRQRMGQLNLACHHCHQSHWGRQLLADTISQGHGSGYPAYRFEWQKIGSLQRRLRACYFGLRAEMPEYGSSELLALELYLAWRATGLAVEAPGVRK
jgi:sulfur-oxidizing protein SoxA